METINAESKIAKYVKSFHYPVSSKSYETIHTDIKLIRNDISNLIGGFAIDSLYASKKYIESNLRRLQQAKNNHTIFP